MHNIRPYKFFQVLEGLPSERIVSTTVPYRRGKGGLTLLEMFIVMAATRIIMPNQVFEIGTFLGNTTMNLALNIPAESTVYTLDLDVELAGRANQDRADAPSNPTASRVQGLLGLHRKFC